MFSIIKNFIVPIFLVLGIANYLMYISTGKTMVSDLIESAKRIKMPNTDDFKESLEDLSLPMTEGDEKGSAQVYKWTDANGTVHFSETPPENSEAALVHVDPNTNIIMAPESAAKDDPDEDKRAAPSSNDIEFKGAGQLIEDAKKVRDQLNERYSEPM